MFLCKLLNEKKKNKFRFWNERRHRRSCCCRRCCCRRCCHWCRHETLKKSSGQLGCFKNPLTQLVFISLTLIFSCIYLTKYPCYKIEFHQVLLLKILTFIKWKKWATFRCWMWWKIVTYLIGTRLVGLISVKVLVGLFQGLPDQA